MLVQIGECQHLLDYVNANDQLTALLQPISLASIGAGI